jgi:GT2 family glycosyltransferase
LAKGQGDYFLVAHPDVTFMSGTIREMLSFLATHPRVGIVGGNCLYPDGSYNDCSTTRLSIRQKIAESAYYLLGGTVRWIPWFYEELKKQRDLSYWDHLTTAESEVIWNACMMFKREVLETIGGFCEEFYVWFADCDWCYRAADAGWKAYYLPEAKVIHYETRSNDYLDSEMVRYKVDAFLVRDLQNADMYTLLKRHHDPSLLWFSKIVHTLSLWRTLLRRWSLGKWYKANRTLFAEEHRKVSEDEHL